MPQPRLPTNRLVGAASSDSSALTFLKGVDSSSSALRFLEGSGFFSASAASESAESSESSSESSESSED